MPLVKISPALDNLVKGSVTYGNVKIMTEPRILMEIVHVFHAGMLDDMGVKEDMEILLFACMKREDGFDDLVWLLKRGSEFLVVERNDLVHHADVTNYVLSRIVNPKRLSAIIRAIKNGNIEAASETGRLEKEAIVLAVYESEDDEDGTTYGIEIQKFDNKEAAKHE